MDCFGTYFTHVQTCDDVRVQSATEWTASGHYYTVLLQYYSVPKSTTPALRCTTPLLPQFGRPAGEHGTGRPAGPHGSGRPAGWQDCRPAGRGQNSEQIHGAII